MIFELIILVSSLLSLFPINDCKIHRVHLDDRILQYYDKTVTSYKNYFSHENFIFEQIDDDHVLIGGYLESLKSMVRNLPIQLHVRTQYYDKARWNEGAYQITLPDACQEFVNRQRLWYNITKLWKYKVCPSQIGDKWEVEENNVNILVDMPPSILIVPWKAYVLVSQGLPGFEIVKYGFGFKMEFLPIK